MDNKTSVASPNTAVPKPSGIRRWLPRFSLRTLLILVMLIGSGGMLWAHWKPWAVEHQYSGLTSVCDCLHFSPDGRWICAETANDDSRQRNHFLKVVVWKRETGEFIPVVDETWAGEMPREIGRGFGSYFSPNSKLLIVRHIDEKKHILHIFKLDPISEIPLMSQNFDIMFTSISPSGRYIFAPALNSSGHIVDIETLSPTATVPDEVRRVCFFSESEQFAYYCADDSIRVCQLTTGEELFRIPKQEGWEMEYVYTATLAQRSVLIARCHRTECEWGTDCHTLIFDLHYGVDRTPQILEGALYEKSPDSHRGIVSCDDKLRVVDLQTMNSICEIPSNGLRFYCVFLDDSRTIMRFSPCAAYDSDSGMKIYEIPHSDRWPYALSSDCHRAICGPASSLLIIATKNGETLQHLGGYDRLVSFGNAFSDDPYHFLTQDGSTFKVKVWYRRRPEYWWGLAWLPEFWLTLAFGSALVWSLWKDQREASTRAASA